MISERARATARKYRGDIATGYEARRVGQAKWRAEHQAMERMLAGLEPGASVLDIPVGTGRFLPLCEARGFAVTGVDISLDMLKQARAKGVSGAVLRRGDIFAIDAPAGSFDVVLAIRILNLIAPDDMRRALAEVQRVARRWVIFNLRVWHPETRYRHPQKMEDVRAALAPGWRVAEDVPLHEPDFRMIRLACGG